VIGLGSSFAAFSLLLDEEGKGKTRMFVFLFLSILMETVGAVR
jgi:hypothetical protein